MNSTRHGWPATQPLETHIPKGIPDEVVMPQLKGQSRIRLNKKVEYLAPHVLTKEILEVEKMKKELKRRTIFPKINTS